MSKRLFEIALAALAWVVRLAPALALLSLTVTAHGLVAWAGLLGIVPLALAFTNIPGCRCGRSGGMEAGFRFWPGH